MQHEARRLEHRAAEVTDVHAVADERVEISVPPNHLMSDPSPVSNTDGAAFKWLRTAIRRTYPEAVIAPALVIGATDARSFSGMSDQIFRFAPTTITPEDLPRIHGANERASVQKFLDEHHSAVRNLIIDTDDVYAVQAAFDSKWESGVPFTIVLAPDGKEIYRVEGEADVLALRRKILGNLPDAGMFAGNTEYWRK